MNDCPNAVMRDRLPDLLHDRLDAAVRAEVEAHVAGCIDCQAELVLLRDLRVAMAQTPRMDVARIAAALPGSPPRLRVAPARRTWVDWRIAAAVTLLLAGGTSVATIVGGGGEPVLPGSSIANVAGPGGEGSTSVAGVEAGGVRNGATSQVTTTVASAPTQVYVAGGLADLSVSELETLLEEFETLDALPIAEPEVQVVPLAASPEEES